MSTPATLEEIQAVTAHTIGIGTTRLDLLMGRIDAMAVDTLLEWVASPKRWESRSSMKFWSDVFTLLICHATPEQIDRMEAPEPDQPYRSDMRKLLDRLQPFIVQVVHWRAEGRTSEADLSVPLPKKKADLFAHIVERVGDPAWTPSGDLARFTAKTRMSLQTEEGLAILAALLLHGQAEDLATLEEKSRVEPVLLPILAAHGVEVVDEAAERLALLERVGAAPGDEGPGLVFADWLIERNDPRGAFIQAQLAGGSPKATRKQRVAWTGEIAELLRVKAETSTSDPEGQRRWPRFHRGFLSGCCVETLDGTAHDAPEWATVRVLDVMKSIEGLDQYTLPRLQVLGGLHSRDLPTLLKSPVAEQIEGIGLRRVLKGDVSTLWDRLAELPRLRFLVLERWWNPEALLQHPLLDRLELLSPPSGTRQESPYTEIYENVDLIGPWDFYEGVWLHAHDALLSRLDT